MAYGETEFWPSLYVILFCNSWERVIDLYTLLAPGIKAIALIVFFIIAICITSGAIGPGPIRFRYCHHPAAFAD